MSIKFNTLPIHLRIMSYSLPDFTLLFIFKKKQKKPLNVKKLKW